MNRSCTMRLAILCLGGLILGACSSTPDTRFYTLNPLPQFARESVPVSPAPAYTVTVGPIRLPDLIDRPQLVIREGGNEVKVLEQHRWGQPLRAEIAQTLATGLAAKLPNARITLDRDAASQNANFRIAVDVKRFEALPGEAVLVQALWTIQPNGVKGAYTGQTTVKESLRSTSYDEIAAAWSGAVLQLSEEIGAAIHSLKTTQARPVK